MPDKNKNIIDKVDHKILEILQNTGRDSASHIASEIGMSVPAVSERIHKLEQNGIISGYEAIIDPKNSQQLITQEENAIKSLGKLSSLVKGDNIGKPSSGNLVTIVSGQIVVGLYLEGILDVPSELARLNNEIAEATSNLERIQALLSKDNFLSNAPAEVIEKEKQRGSSLEAKLSSLREVTQQLNG